MKKLLKTGSLLAFLLAALITASSLGLGAGQSASAATLISDLEYTTVVSTKNDLDTDTGFTAVSNLNAWGARSYYNYKVKLDGLSITFNTTPGNGDCIGFVFTNDPASGFFGAASPLSITLWKALHAGQSRLHVGASHDYNGASKVHVAPDADSAKGFAVASSMVINDQATVGMNIKFTAHDAQWYKVTITMTHSTMWDKKP